MRPSGLQANDAPPRDMSPSPVRPTCLGQHFPADARGDVQGEGSSSNRSATADTDAARDIAKVRPAGASAERDSKRAEFTADPDEVIEIRARGRHRSAKVGTTPQCLRKDEGTKLESAPKHTQVQQSKVRESNGGSRPTVLRTSDGRPLLSSTDDEDDDSLDDGELPDGITTPAGIETPVAPSSPADSLSEEVTDDDIFGEEDFEALEKRSLLMTAHTGR